jgi:nitrile hydratase subunit beta
VSAFAQGDRVRVLDVFAPGHVRTPFYVRGKSGIVARVVGTFDNPEELGWGRKGDARSLYRIRFKGTELFPDAAPRDEVDVDVFEHWLEKA